MQDTDHLESSANELKSQLSEFLGRVRKGKMLAQTVINEGEDLIESVERLGMDDADAEIKRLLGLVRHEVNGRKAVLGRLHNSQT